ncbi:hypothetical protein CEXT_601221 [Caerostris extrusa]|uniref:Uncharacterized protein n=1 Tax=Caerostris extrusa TaxID=172846 RepID=A0AAV4RKS5_CAEEX|nr:hypothetical protein CEXT_601221 [Caerostris extrusa]
MSNKGNFPIECPGEKKVEWDKWEGCNRIGIYCFPLQLPFNYCHVTQLEERSLASIMSPGLLFDQSCQDTVTGMRFMGGSIFK